MTTNTHTPWRVLIVDDEPGLHDVTRLICRRMKFKHKPVELLSAHSAAEAMEVLQNNHDIAVALVDVIMENDHAGLDLVRDIRLHFPQHQNMRIILRTGNPGMAPQREVIQHYDIDDYREKTELTADRLFTSVYTAIRAYETLLTLNKTVNGLEHILSSKEDLAEDSNALELLRTLLQHITQVIHKMDSGLVLKDGFIAQRVERDYSFAQAWGSYAAFQGQPLGCLDADEELITSIHNIAGNTFLVSDKGIALALSSQSDVDYILWIKTESLLGANTLHILNLFIHRLLLSIENNKLHKDLLEAHQTALNKLCEAIEMRSKETGQHIYRMAKYSKLLAQLCGLSAREVNLIEATAPLHDIGKIATPDAILSKPGKLDDEEMKEMRLHAQHGYDMLADSNSEMLKLGALVALTHHERWDGTGYPNGTAGENIPLAGRIVSLADVFDALMSRRSYKESFSYEKTMAIITENAGKHFDPKLVELLQKNGEQFLQIFIDNPDQPLALVA
ncbi:HD domain-containing phosphohydrolase [Zwartia sp.]|uniref:HD domain-containing phosphohydrolase n=1 Tax=Zwartia sp. TaxID=2978004 RepID=UPI0027201E90|nr:HD domain-containing phosphohydrolase [Zwartia sp.]MDO9023733.1 DUF3369 domain-containing protein [Zwartia sp.]